MTRKPFYLLSLLCSLSTTTCFGAAMLETQGNDVGDSWQITIQNPEEETLFIDATPASLVSDVKESIYAKVNIAVQDQSLLFDGETLKDDQTLLSYDIENGETLLLVPIEEEGGFASFSFSNFKKKVEKKFSNNAPDWRILTKGLNLEGICTNPQCDAHNKKVWVQKGFGKFNIAKEFTRSFCPMPNCKKKVKEIEQCGFFYCKYVIEGETVDEQKVSLKGSHKKTSGFEKFLAGGEDSARYTFLEITVTKH